MAEQSHTLNPLDPNKETELLLVQALALLMIADNERRPALRRAMLDPRARKALTWLAEEITIMLLLTTEAP